MQKIELLELLEFLEEYVLVKKDPQFPIYSSGSDIDLFIIDKKYSIKKIYDYYNNKLSNFFEMHVKEKKYNTHIDFLFNNKLELRIDLIHSLDFFTKFSVKAQFISKVFKDRLQISINGVKIFFPKEEDDLTIRYFEYLEYFDRFSNKEKHYKFISNISDVDLEKKFILNSHRFISFCKNYDNYQINSTYFPFSRKQALNNILRNIVHIFKVTFRLK